MVKTIKIHKIHKDALSSVFFFILLLWLFLYSSQNVIMLPILYGSIISLAINFLITLGTLKLLKLKSTLGPQWFFAFVYAFIMSILFVINILLTFSLFLLVILFISTAFFVTYHKEKNFTAGIIGFILTFVTGFVFSYVSGYIVLNLIGKV